MLHDFHETQIFLQGVHVFYLTPSERLFPRAAKFVTNILHFSATPKRRECKKVVSTFPRPIPTPIPAAVMDYVISLSCWAVLFSPSGSQLFSDVASDGQLYQYCITAYFKGHLQLQELPSFVFFKLDKNILIFVATLQDEQNKTTHIVMTEKNPKRSLIKSDKTYKNKQSRVWIILDYVTFW